VETAASGLECLAKLREVEPDVLIVDLDMPWGGGDGVIALTKERRDLATVPAVLVVGAAPRSVLADRVGVPRSNCYQKPVRLERLLDAVGLVIALAEERNSIDAMEGRRVF